MLLTKKQISRFLGVTRNITAGISAVNMPFSKYQYPNHIAYIDRTVCQRIYKGGGRLIINMPPRHGKSELISKYLPFWFLGNFPMKKVILTSYEANFAAGWGRKVRDLVEENGSRLFGISLDESSYSGSNFLLKTRGGGMSTAGSGGPITGKGADLLIIDDPVKNDAEAMSQTIRDNIWDWFLATAYTRIEPGGSVVIIMTRWHQDDLIGRILNSKELKKNWDIINLPAFAEENDILGRQIGQPLWNERYSAASLNNIKSTLGNYWFSSLYQQSPYQKEGALFRKQYFRYFTEQSDGFLLELPTDTKYRRNINMTVYAAVDLAVKTTERSDYTVAVIALYSPEGDILISDVIREKLESASHLDLLRNIYQKYKPSVIGIESVQYQTSLIESAMRAGLPVTELKANKDKMTRAIPMAAKMENGIVYFRKDALWLREFERELEEFPDGRHDDQADAFAYLDRIISYSSGSYPMSMKRQDYEE